MLHIQGTVHEFIQDDYILLGIDHLQPNSLSPSPRIDIENLDMDISPNSTAAARPDLFPIPASNPAALQPGLYANSNAVNSNATTPQPRNRRGWMKAPFAGSYSGIFWNSQALFATDEETQDQKQKYTEKIITNKDFAGLAETHSTLGRTTTATLFPHFKPFWAHGTTQTAGIGLLVNKDFLEKFHATSADSWQIIVPGRAARLRLEGPEGSLDIYVLYLRSGRSSEVRKERAELARRVARLWLHPDLKGFR